jgi:DnaK suppressor protein
MIPLAFDSLRRLEERRQAIERSASANLDETLAQELLETQAALRRLSAGTYGRCEGCGGAVGRQRLLALPAARYCVGCASDGT